MWKIITSFNLNPPLKLFFYSPILTNNNLLLKIYCENIVVVFFNQDFLFFILFFFLSFHFNPYTFHFFFSFFFFLFFSSTQVSSVHSYLYPPFFYFLFHLKNIPATTFTLHQRERERVCCSSAAPSPMEIKVAKRTKSVEISIHHAALPHLPTHRRSSSSPLPGYVKLACSFFFFSFFSYLLVQIQLYFKNLILFCVLCLDYVRNRENERKKKNFETERKN